jgi:hypothetical protein
MSSSHGSSGTPSTSGRISPRVGPGGLVTVAYIKARLDEGKDQIGIFQPLVIDAVANITTRHFAVAEVQESIASRNGVTMPQETVSTLLRRAARDGLLIRDAGRFRVNPNKPLPIVDLVAAKASLGASQDAFGHALADFMRSRRLNVADASAALDLLLQFLLEQQVTVILGAALTQTAAGVSHRHSTVIAEFLRDIVPGNDFLQKALAGILQGLVLYHASFLPDLADVARRFDNLTVAFDTVLVRQALGYEGTAPRVMLRETIDLLAASDVRCVVFDKTVREIQRILHMFQDKLATSAGRESLRPGPMVRHFLTQRYAPSDVQEMSALLESEIRAAGLTIVRVPPHEARFTGDERKLAARLANPKTGDLAEPRVEHDVDCVAAVLTLRRGHRADRVENARVVFATISPLVIQSTRLWWESDEAETGVPPIVHVRALANLAWLKRPKVSPDFQLQDLIAVCGAAMSPTSRTWNRFLKHLDRLQKEDRLTEDQATAIVISSMSDSLLRDAEIESDDPADIDAGTLDEVVARVTEQYSEQADARVREAEEKRSRALERLRRRELQIDGRARGWAAGLANAAFLGCVVIVAAAAITLMLSTVVQGGLILGAAALVLLVLEASGYLDQLRSAQRWLELKLHRAFRRLLAAGELDTDD